MSDWKNIELCGAVSIERVCGIYEITELDKIPGTKVRVKVLERVDGTYIAVANVWPKTPEGIPDGEAGLGRSEVEALQDVVRALMAAVNKRENPSEDDFAWTDPIDFL